jgi:hypothetical protein
MQRALVPIVAAMWHIGSWMQFNENRHRRIFGKQPMVP